MSWLAPVRILLLAIAVLCTDPAVAQDVKRHAKGRGLFVILEVYSARSGL